MQVDALLGGLKRLAEPITAPYHEASTRDALRAWLHALDLPTRVDEDGNTWVRLVRAGAKSRGAPRPLAFVAHLDHPALRVCEQGPSSVACAPLGQLPTRGLRGARVRFVAADARSCAGTIVGAAVRRNAGRPCLEAVRVRLDRGDAAPTLNAIGVFDLPACRRRGHSLALRAADDLVGCAAIVAALSDLRQASDAVDITAIFTRAEEVGLQGALALGVSGALTPQTWVVSVECSASSGKIKPGRGPVVRLGDRAGPFAPAVCALVRGAARNLGPDFVFQEASMPGGICEATALSAFGYACGGVALPVDNYHNQGRAEVAPEIVDLRDLQGAARLLVETAKRAAAGVDDVARLREDLLLRAGDGLKRLRDGYVGGETK